ncbi:MAG: helix-turn-helix domain-containing protein [Tannerella sp.]|jgi:AraC-like DNA-binding protein|nr:helix-turn-helix domain-containing protein [Tannerella sp.]
MYKEYPPDIRLLHLIETYWVSDGVVSTANTQRILPDGCVDILFNFSNNDGTGRLFPYIPHIVGTTTSHLDITYYSGVIMMLGIRFRPNGITAFTRMPIFELTDKTVEIALAETLFEKSFYDRLPELPTMRERLTYLNNYLISRLPDYFPLEKRIDFAIDYIRSENGLLSVKQMAEKVCLCERQFERIFKSAIGVSPKTFSRIIRFKRTVDFLRTYPKESLYNAAIDCGYFDHSHLIKDFKEFGGTLPGELT